jgi:hypothetical protein
MFDSQEISLRKLAVVATTQESASYFTKEIWAATTKNNIEKVTKKPQTLSQSSCFPCTCFICTWT